MNLAKVLPDWPTNLPSDRGDPRDPPDPKNVCRFHTFQGGGLDQKCEISHLFFFILTENLPKTIIDTSKHI